jgi:hypothetical protein
MADTAAVIKTEPNTNDGYADSDGYSDEGEVCWWCRGGVLLPKFTNKKDRICEPCEKVKIFQFFMHNADKYDPDKPEQIELDWLDEMASRKKCPLCRIVVHALRDKHSIALTDSILQNGKVNVRRVKCSIERMLPEGHDSQGRTAFGCMRVMTEPLLDDHLEEIKQPDITRLRHPIAVLLSDGCLESRHMYGGVK